MGDSRLAQVLQLLDDLRHERLVAGGERADADDVHVSVDGLLRGLARRLPAGVKYHVSRTTRRVHASKLMYTDKHAKMSTQ